MKVTVIIPVFNRADLVRRAVESVLAQTYRPEQIIIVDDGSTDDPRASLQEIVSSDLIKIIRQQNAGVAAARNVGIEAARTNWLAFLDSDDWWLPEKLSRQISWHNANLEYLISQTDEVWIRNGRRVNPKKYHQKQNGEIFYLSLDRCLISPSSVLLSRRLFDEVGLFDPSLPACEDYDLWLRITARHLVGLVPEKLIIKTGGHADQLSRKYWGMDRFRVKSIMKLLRSGDLTKAQYQAALDVCEKKVVILKNGAAKRRHVALQRDSS